MFTLVLDKKEISRIKKEFKNYDNTMSYQFNKSEFKKLRTYSDKNENAAMAFHYIEFPDIENTKKALGLDKPSWIHKTYRNYEIWALDYNGLSVLVSYNEDRGTDYYIPINTDTKLVYVMLYDLQKMIYEYSGKTDFEQYYPTWENL